MPNRRKKHSHSQRHSPRQRDRGKGYFSFSSSLQFLPVPFTGQRELNGGWANVVHRSRAGNKSLGKQASDLHRNNHRLQNYLKMQLVVAGRTLLSGSMV